MARLVVICFAWGLALLAIASPASSDRLALEILNVVGEVHGDTKPAESVVLGAHLDSWDLGQGALDNGCNAVLVIDAARQIAVVAREHRPGRTIRFVLFTGEEAGFLARVRTFGCTARNLTRQWR
jgi:carboxypeptidase Q